MAILADGFTAGANVPPVVSATGPDYTTFQQQLYADIVRQNEAVGRRHAEVKLKIVLLECPSSNLPVDFSGILEMLKWEVAPHLMDGVGRDNINLRTDQELS
ncbi:hypothetical protein VOLCADRAFT_87954 [Volvox carteri f. nagariensis]|uniref:Uncharacterized protein n=1 Tax=Volvox carteri f. nagariensis TaxID=3068 RepID=D8TMP3_VOLCA|nr:uncharacterized protein VOLCADRAFT_87954 [Volvox carteri f. nagariensis]EFJ51287.1 hypothetical protein VOLCADRAFT_87954 [Volvox carteri f. nagariensis]|eukprot:XP_002947754.1 hypothetical protein VOLCADRAFT_87954 [Volvox carteri f. nagariensis]